MPSLTSVNDSVTDVSVFPATARSATVPGCCTTGGGLAAPVVPLAMLESPPNATFRLSVPRKAISWTPYAVAGESPSTVHVRLAPIVVPASGDVHVPRAAFDAEPQEIAPGA